MSGLRILVTGAMSSLGRAVGQILKLHGHRSVGTIRRDPGVTDLSMYEEIVYADLTSCEQIEAINSNIDAVIHIAGQSTGTITELMSSVSLSTAWLSDFAIRRGAKSFIHISSMSVYGDIREDVVTASTVIRHARPYGAAKFAAECFLHDRRESLPSVSIRCPAIVGIESRGNFLAELFRAMKAKSDVVQVSNPHFLFNNIVHESTLAKFLVHLATTPRHGFSAVPVCSSTPLLLSEIVDRIRVVTQFQGTIDWVPAKAPTFSISPADAYDFGFQPETTDETISMWLAG